MREPVTRQLFSPRHLRGAASRICAAFWLLLSAAGVSRGQEATPPPPRDQVHQEVSMAQGLEIALRQQKGGEPEAARIAKIEQVYRDIVARHRESSEAHSALGDFLWAENRRADAIGEWREAVKLDARNPAPVFQLANADLAQGDIPEAAGGLRKCTEMDPKNALYHFSLGNLLFLFRHQLAGGPDAAENGVMSKALAELRSATQLAPASEEYAKGYAETFYAVPMPDWTEAVAAWSHFLQVTPDKSLAYLNLARVHLQMGRRSEARDDLAKITDAKFDRLKEKMLKDSFKAHPAKLRNQP